MRLESEPDVEMSLGLTELFREAVSNSLHHQELAATEAAANYVVSLLVDYASPGHPSPELVERPVTLSLQEALSAHPNRRFQRLCELGDWILYSSGFFRAHLERRGLEPEFVSRLGARAYGAASSMLHAQMRDASLENQDVLAELSSHFAEFSALMTRVAECLAAGSARSPQQLLELYERWLRTGSPELAAALWDHGVIPRAADGVLH